MPRSVDVARQIAGAWLQKAQGDLAMAEVALASGRAPAWAIGFHCQQCAEKAIKGRLVLAGVEPPPTHSFAKLNG